MIESSATKESDLAFVRAVIEDRGPLPRPFGAHLVVAGLTFGLNFVYAWLGQLGLVPWPLDSRVWTWLPGAVAYLVIAAPMFMRGGRSAAIGPTGRVFIAAWGAMALMIVPTVAVTWIASEKMGAGIVAIWPALSFVHYGGAWCVAGLIRRKAWYGLVAFGCFVTAGACAISLDTPALWLAMAIGLLLFVTAPGVAIMLRARPST